MTSDFDNNSPIYLQIVDSIKNDIISGKLMCASKLPSVRDYASEFKVNPNTMQKSLIELENLGLIYTERTSGKYVTTNNRIISKYKNKYVSDIVNNYFKSMQSIGIEKQEAINLLRKGEY